jgi:AraC-like DNA-binding protein
LSVLFPELQEGLYVRIFSAGYMEVGDWWRDTDHLRGFWRLYLNEQEGVTLTVGRKAYPLPAGAIVLVPASLEFRISLRQPVQQLFTLFEFIGWPPDVAREILPGPTTVPADSLMDALAGELAKELGGTTGPLTAMTSSRLKALVHLAIAAVLSQVPAERARRVLRINEGQRELLAVLQHIDENLAEPMSNARLAEIALSSESRFIRRFREATGRTPARYVQERRLERASELLISTDFSIDRVAETCGFANRYYFTRVFTQRMGLPPGRYRSERPHLPGEEPG